MYWTAVYASWKIYSTLRIVRGLLWQYYEWRLKITFLQYKSHVKEFPLCAHLLRSGGAPHVYFSHITHSSQSRQGWDECTISDSALLILLLPSNKMEQGTEPVHKPGQRLYRVEAVTEYQNWISSGLARALLPESMNVDFFPLSN